MQNKYKFINPNTADVTADFLLKTLLIELNKEKVEQAIERYSETSIPTEIAG